MAGYRTSDMDANFHQSTWDHYLFFLIDVEGKKKF